MELIIVILAFVAAFVITFVSGYLAVALVAFVGDMYLKIKQYCKRV